MDFCQCTTAANVGNDETNAKENMKMSRILAAKFSPEKHLALIIKKAQQCPGLSTIMVLKQV